MDCELPDEFELIVIGTGMVESIVASAASRIGKKVLHVDSKDYYGGMWSSFNLEGMEKYIIHDLSSSSKQCTTELSGDFLKEGESFLNLGNDVFGIRDVAFKWHVQKEIVKEPEIVEKKEEIQVENEPCIKVEESSIETLESTQTEPNVKPTEPVVMEPTKEFTQEYIMKQSRKFNLDLTPKLQFARGDFVELLISSNIARYSEYRCINRVITWLNGHLEVVPCSRSDVFSNSRVTVVEKRMLMKLLSACLHGDAAQFSDYQNKTFFNYLKDKKLTPNLIHYVLYAISMSDQTTPCLEGVAKTKRFLNSLGKFGKTPFLYSSYGSGELPQAFCRLCAVFGGTYCLNRPLNSLILNGDKKITGVICDKKKISAENVVLAPELCPEQFTTSWKTQKISRAIFITDKSILACEKENLTLLLFPPEAGKTAITVIELGPSTGTCPQDFYVVHMICKQVENAESDFAFCVQSLLSSNKKADSAQPLDTEILPKILWSLYFTIVSTTDICDFAGLAENLYPCTGPDLDLDYDNSVKKAKDIFANIYPDLEFLPRAPDPEEIILCDEEEDKEEETVVSQNEQNEEKLKVSTKNQANETVQEKMLESEESVSETKDESVQKEDSSSETNSKTSQ